MPLGKAAGAAAVQDPSRFSDATGFRASVLECASPLALFPETYQAVEQNRKQSDWDAKRDGFD